MVLPEIDVFSPVGALSREKDCRHPTPGKVTSPMFKTTLIIMQTYEWGSSDAITFHPCRI